MRPRDVLALLEPAKGSPLYGQARTAVLLSYYQEGYEAAADKARTIAEAYEDVALERRFKIG